MITKLKNLFKKILPPPTQTVYALVGQLTEKLFRKADQLLSAVKNQHVGTRKYLDEALERNQKQLVAVLERSVESHQAQMSVALEKSMERNQAQLIAALERSMEAQKKHMDAIWEESMNNQQTMLNQLQNSYQELQENMAELMAEKDALTQKLHHIQRQMVLSNAVLVTCASNHPEKYESSWDVFQEQFAEANHPLAFLEVFYHLHDALTATKTMEVMGQEYINTALEACLRHLHSEKDPSSRQLIYDALKNEVFDALELTGHEASFYTDETAYREMQRIVERPYDYDYFSVLSKPFYEQALVKWYKEKTGRVLNLKNPATYNDKLNWMKLNEQDPRKTRYTDKHNVREYVAETIGSQYLMPMLGVWDDPADIDFNTLPDKFVLKTTHGSGWNIIVSDKSVLDIPETVKRLKWWMNRKISYCNGLELHYDGIRPRVIAEQFMENNDGELNDYKVWCFGGKAHFIQYLAERKHGLKMAFYDLDWNKMPFISNHEQIVCAVEKPENLDELITLSEQLAAGFNHVRVDFYRLNSGEWKFGEMTFTPGGGRCIWNPPEYDGILGELFDVNYQSG